ncbi:class I SAM-dependent methyltransferase [Blastococcus sp. TF02A-30]|uniref:class I SAM-dependent methyltransferase n=1 Tax=Blastococcus sp. TF02A-30 TaxID=2250580 RepID=UPI000DEBF281|nr:class I SAM-dependent methyltransferase [Blastococcus sp. TF02A-30]RBY86541.1 class I SAM-dependent methyltransferase [Blastococcus sp. TF02A-30]
MTQRSNAVVAAVRRWTARHLLAPVEARVARVVRAEIERAVQEVRDAEFRARRDLLAVGERDAALSSARWAAERMPTVRVFHDPTSTLRYALEIAPRGGMALEFGVFTGRSLAEIARARPGGRVYGFDSFRGLPEDYRPHVREGAFAVDRLPRVEGAELVVGLFADTLPGFLAEHVGPVDLVHVDGDLYSSAVTVLDLLGPRLGAGSVLVFDEFFNYPGWQQHEFRAWREWQERTGAEVAYEAYTGNDEQVVVRIISPGPDAPTG